MASKYILSARLDEDPDAARSALCTCESFPDTSAEEQSVEVFHFMPQIREKKGHIPLAARAKGELCGSVHSGYEFLFEKLIFLQTPVSFFDLPKAERVEEPILRCLTGFAAKNLARLKNYPEFVGAMEKNAHFCVRLLITGKCPSPPKKKTSS